LDSEADIDVVASKLKEKLGTDVSKVSWCSDFIAIPGYIPISSLNGLEAAISEFGVFPMDVSSGIAAKLLLMNMVPQAGVKVLDLCCCPGGKFCMLADEIDRHHSQRSNHVSGDGSEFSRRHLVVGVDIAKQRLQVCKSVVSKLLMRRHYSNPGSDRHSTVRQLLFEADGTTFGKNSITSLVYDSALMETELRMEELKARNLSAFRAADGVVAAECNSTSNSEIEGPVPESKIHASSAVAPPVRKSFANKSARKREARHLSDVMLYDIGGQTRPSPSIEADKRVRGASAPDCCNNPVDLTGFDYVLVDAQCTHDASYRHLNVSSSSATPGSSNVVKSDGGVEEQGNTAVAKGKSWVKTDNILRSLLNQQEASGGGDGGSDCRDNDALLANSLQKLQRQLLYRAFELMGCSEEGGQDRCFIYSTCSMKREQNEDVVQWLLDRVNGGIGEADKSFRVKLAPISSQDFAQLSVVPNHITVSAATPSTEESKLTQSLVNSTTGEITVSAATPNTEESKLTQSLVNSTTGEESKLTQSLVNSTTGESIVTVRGLLQSSHSDEEFCRVIQENMAKHDVDDAQSGPTEFSVQPVLRQMSVDVCTGVASAVCCRFEPSEILPGSVRLNRYSSGTSGLFIAKLEKVKI